MKKLLMQSGPVYRWYYTIDFHGTTQSNVGLITELWFASELYVIKDSFLKISYTYWSSIGSILE